MLHTQAWQDKYEFNFWRPIIGIRRADESPITAGLEDGNWTQLGAPNTNRARPGIQPAFPAYPSGHATFGTAVLDVVKLQLHLAGAQTTACDVLLCTQRWTEITLVLGLCTRVLA